MKLGIGLLLLFYVFEKLNNVLDFMFGMKKFGDEFYYILDNILFIIKCIIKCIWFIVKEYFMLFLESISLYWLMMICFMKLYEYFF